MKTSDIFNENLKNWLNDSTQSAKPTHYFFGDDIVFAVEPGVDIIKNIFTSR